MLDEFVDMQSELIAKIMDIVSDGIIITDGQLVIKEINKYAQKYLQVTRERLINVNLNMILKDIKLRKSILEGKNYENQNNTFYLKNRRVKCTVSAYPIRFKNNLKGVLIVFRKLTRNIGISSVNKVKEYAAVYNFEDIITVDERMKKIIQYAKKAAYTDCNILIEGASGTGKELFAQAIHNFSKRPDGPFVAINCAAIPKDLIESELFGYEKGAFTGASQKGRCGKFELAHGGSLFLDEIGELPLELQSKLLRTLDNQKITRVGGTKEKKVDVRVISATNRVLSEEVNKKNFRFDLYYRVNVISIHLMKLRDRPKDIEALTHYFICKLNESDNTNITKIDLEYMLKLKKYNWPGNVRELKNAIERAYYLCDGDTIKDDYTQYNILNIEKKYSNKKIIPLAEVERKYILEVLSYCQGNIVKAAEMLKISRATIYRKIKKYGIKWDDFS